MFTGGVAGGYGILQKPNASPKYRVAILNSPVAAWYISQTSTQMRGGWYSFESRYIKNIPVPKQPKSIDMLENKVDEIMLMKDFTSVIRDSLINEINNLIYRLYELTNDEIAIVENSSA